MGGPGRRVQGLIPAQPPKEAIEACRKQANAAAGHDHDHTVANPAKGEPAGERGAEPPKTGYRPGRNSAKRQVRRKKGSRVSPTDPPPARPSLTVRACAVRPGSFPYHRRLSGQSPHGVLSLGTNQAGHSAYPTVVVAGSIVAGECVGPTQCHDREHVIQF